MQATTPMPATTLPPTPLYTPPPPTAAELDWADLPVIDLALAQTEAGRVGLSEKVRDALASTGFFYVINHGYAEEQTSHIFNIANVAFEGVPFEEKKQYEGDPTNSGSYQGYKLRAFWHIDNGVKDEIETFNIHRDVTKRGHPEALRPYLPDVSSFARFNHEQVLYPILRLLARGLQLPEETLVNQHSYEGTNETYVRFMKYFPRSAEDEEKTKGIWLKGHTDIGSVTILWSQPVSALQIQSPDGKWRWVKHLDNALVINAGDCLEFLSGGYYKATIHRVVQPPPDQQHLQRLGVFYFSLPDENVKLEPLMDSPVLQKMGVNENDRFRRHEVDVAMVAGWRKARTATYGQTKPVASNQDGVEEEIINGVVVKHYT